MPLSFTPLQRREVVADFSGGYLSSDGGVLLLRQIDLGLGLSGRLSRCFVDLRNPRYCDHSLQELLQQRLLAMALGYDDLNDHDRLRFDPLLAVGCGKSEPLGRDRQHEHPAGVALAGSATLNRLELGHEPTGRYRKIHYDADGVEATLLEMGVRALPKQSREIVVDLDSMGHLVHGLQEGRHFSAYYGNYCLQPLYAFVGSIPLWARLRPGNCDAGLSGVLEAMESIVAAIRRRSPKARILFRGDSAFAREETMAWCEKQPQVYYCFGLGPNPRLLEQISPALLKARMRHALTGATVREFVSFEYQTRKSWSRSRRVVGKAEVMAAGDNPRFVVTNLPEAGFDEQEPLRFEARALYEEFYCGRGEMENMLKQQVLDLPGDRMSCHDLAANQLRLWLATLAYLLLERLRSQCLRGTELATATVGTIRLRLLKVAAQVQVSVRRVYIRFCSAFPLQWLYRLCAQRMAVT